MNKNFHRNKKYDLTFLDQLIPLNKNDKYRVIDGVNIKLRSQRYTLFRKSITCCECGLEASFFASERDLSNGTINYHINLYGLKNGEEILFTKDHIIPKSKGGKNIISNYQTMCQECNVQKGNNIDCDVCNYDKKDIIGGTRNFLIKKHEDDIIIYPKKHIIYNSSFDLEIENAIEIAKIRGEKRKYTFEIIQDDHFYIILK